MQLLQGDSLTQCKQAFRELLQVQRVQRIHGCICCSPAKARPFTAYSEPGAKEYDRTGLCEYCFDAFFGEDPVTTIHTLSRLTFDGMNILALWVLLSKASRHLSVPPGCFAVFERVRLHRDAIRVYR